MALSADMKTFPIRMWVMNIRKFRAAFLTLMVAALVAVPAAAAQTAPEARSETPATASPRTTVRVVNNNWHDITVYASRAGYRHRLGKVTSFTSRVFTLPPRFLVWSGELRLIADPFAPVGFSSASSGRSSGAPNLLAELGTTNSSPRSTGESGNLRRKRKHAAREGGYLS